MPAKQAKVIAEGVATAVVVATAPAANQSPKSLYMTVCSFDPDGTEIGRRVVDQYHYGTRGWITKHLWWAMHNNKGVTIAPSEPDEIEAYLAESKEALQEKYAKHAA